MKSVERYNRMIRIKLGLFKTARIVRHESLRKTIVCGPTDILETLRTQGALTEYRPASSRGSRGRALIEAQSLERKVRWARNDLIASSAVATVLFIGLALAGAPTQLLILIAVLTPIIDLVPRPVPLTGETESYIPLMYPAYRARLKQLRKGATSNYFSH